MREARPALFTSGDRFDPLPATHLETSFAFLERVPGEYWQQVRDLLQSWLGRVDEDEHYRDLRGRLRADDDAHASALLELYLHELFLRVGYRVSIHPPVPGTRRRPDFLVENDAESFYVEATMPGSSLDAKGRQNRRAAFLDTMQGCRNRDFFLSLDRLVVGQNPAKGRAVRQAVDRWLSALDPDIVRYDLRDEREQFHWAEDGWEVTFSAIPVSAEHRGRPDHRPLGVYADSAVDFVDDAPTIRVALRSKVTAYGELDRPLLVALGTYIWDHDLWHSTNAFYGQAGITWWENADGSIGQESSRQGDGYCGVPPNWQNAGASAVLHINQLQSHRVQGAELTLWPHPSTGEHLSPSTRSCRQA